MENPLLSSDQNEPKPVAPVQPQAPAPASTPAAPESPKPEKKKSFFTTGKILAIVGIAVVVIAIIGAVIYSQTSERFQGSTFTTAGPAPISTTTKPMEPVGTLTVPTVDFIAPEIVLTVPDDKTLVTTCSPEKGQVDLDGRCVCESISIFDPTADTCITNFCGLEEGEIKKAMGDPYTTPETRDELGTIIADYDTWYDANCVISTLIPIETLKFDPLVVTDKDPEPEAITTPDYIRPDLKLSVPDIKTLVPQGCDDYIPALRDAYSTRNWDSFQGSLTKLEGLGCLDNCKSKLLWEVYYLWIGDLAGATTVKNEYESTCTSCDAKFDFMALTSQVLSDIDKTNQEAGSTLPGPYVTYLKTLATNYINTCQCVEIEAFLANPNFNVDDLLPEAPALSVTDAVTSVDTFKTVDKSTIPTESLNLLNTDKFEPVGSQPLTYLNEDVLTIAYAQSSTLSPGITTALEGVFNDLCVDIPTDPDPDPDPQPQNCTALEITLPSANNMTITEDFVSSTDKVEFTATGTDNIANYRITASNDTLVFGGQDDDVYSDYDSLTLSGGPAIGDPVELIVQAIDVTGLPIAACKDSITITRAPVPTDVPVCRSLNIVVPVEANQAGSPEFLIPAGGFVDQNLTVEVDGDQGSWGDIKYNTVTENGDITFNGDATLVTSDQTVTLNGIPTGQTETITVWALDPTTGTGIASCNDSFTIRVDNDSPPTLSYTPPEEDDGPPSLAYTPPEEDDGPPSLAYTPPEEPDDPPLLTYIPPEEDDPIIVDRPRNDGGGSTFRPSAPEDPIDPGTPPVQPGQPGDPYIPSSPAQPGGSTYVATAPLHEAPYTPQTGPGVLIPMIGLALGGAWMRRKRK